MINRTGSKATLGVHGLTEHQPLLRSNSADTPRQKIRGPDIGRQADGRIPCAQFHGVAGQHEVATQGQTDARTAYRSTHHSHHGASRLCQLQIRRQKLFQDVIDKRWQLIARAGELLNIASRAKNRSTCLDNDHARLCSQYIRDGLRQSGCGAATQSVVVCWAIKHNAAHQSLRSPFNTVKIRHAVNPANVCVDGSA